MTIRLLAAYGEYPINAIVTLGAGTEAGLVAAKLASTDTTGGTPYVPPVPQRQRWPVMSETNPVTGGIEFASGDVEPRSIGARVVSGGVAVSTTQLGKTGLLCGRLAARAKAIQLIFFNLCATPTTGVAWAISMLPDDADLTNPAVVNNNSGSYVSGTLNLPARVSSSEYSIAFSDWVAPPIPSAIFSARAHVPVAGNTECTLNELYSATAPGRGSSWAAMQGDEWIMRTAATGDFVTNIAGFSGTSIADWTFIAGVRYLSADGAVVTVMGVGDSIMSGTLGDVSRDSYWVKAVRALKLEGKRIEAINLGWATQNTAQYQPRAINAINAFRPSICLYPPYSPNDGTPDAASISAQLSRESQVRQACWCLGVAYAPVTAAPRGGSTYTAAQDAKRKALNDDIRSRRMSIDIDVALSSTQEYGAAAEFATGMGAADNVHPSEAGNVAASARTRLLLDRLF